MNIKDTKVFCLELPGAVEREQGEPANILAYSIGGKKFAYFKTSEPERWRFSIKVSPERFLELTDQINIKPARYMHRFYWVSIVGVQGVDEDYLKELITWSYQHALSALPKKIQAEIYQ